MNAECLLQISRGHNRSVTGKMIKWGGGAKKCASLLDVSKTVASRKAGVAPKFGACIPAAGCCCRFD